MVSQSEMEDTEVADAHVPTRETQYCTFMLGDALFGVEVPYVQEVLLSQQITKMPLAPATVKGLINLRGQIVTAVDLRERLNMPPLEGRLPMNVVIRTDGIALSLLVDEIDGVLNVDESSFETPPETLSPAARELIVGTYKLKDRLLLALDVEKVAVIPTDAAPAAAAK